MGQCGKQTLRLGRRVLAAALVALRDRLTAPDGEVSS